MYKCIYLDQMYESSLHFTANIVIMEHLNICITQDAYTTVNELNLSYFLFIHPFVLHNQNGAIVLDEM